MDRDGETGAREASVGGDANDAGIDGAPDLDDDAPQDSAAGDLGPDWSPPDDGPHISDGGLPIFGPVCDPCGTGGFETVDLQRAETSFVFDPDLNVPPWEDCGGTGTMLVVQFLNPPANPCFICEGGGTVHIGAGYWGRTRSTCEEAVQGGTTLDQGCDPDPACFGVSHDGYVAFAVMARDPAEGAATVVVDSF